MKLIHTTLISCIFTTLVAQSVPEQTVPEKINKQIDIIITQHKKGAFAFFDLANIYPILRFKVNRDVGKTNKDRTSLPRSEQRRIGVSGYLGQERCKALEGLLLNVLDKSTDKSERILAMKGLSQVLSAETARTVLLEKYRGNPERKLSGAPADIGLDEEFILLESLAYLGADIVRNDLVGILLDDSQTENTRVRALRALVEIDASLSQDAIIHSIRLNNIILSREALSIAKNENLKIDLFDITYEKFTRAAQTLESGNLSDEELSFFSSLITDVIGMHRDKLLNPEMKLKLKSVTKRILQSKDEPTRSVFARLFWELTEEADLDDLLLYLKDENKTVRAFAAFSFIHMPVEILRKHSESLLSLLDDDSFEARRWALFSLCRNTGYRAISSMSKEEFDTLKPKILQYYSNLK